MPVRNTYSKRIKARTQNPDMYQYDHLPAPFRHQVIHIWRDAIGPWGVGLTGHESYSPRAVWRPIWNAIKREEGILDASTRNYLYSDQDECEKLLVKTSSTEVQLDLIELSFRAIETLPRPSRRSPSVYPRQMIPDAAISVSCLTTS